MYTIGMGHRRQANLRGICFTPTMITKQISNSGTTFSYLYLVKCILPLGDRALPAHLLSGVALCTGA